MNVERTACVAAQCVWSVRRIPWRMRAPCYVAIMRHEKVSNHVGFGFVAHASFHNPSGMDGGRWYRETSSNGTMLYRGCCGWWWEVGGCGVTHSKFTLVAIWIVSGDDFFKFVDEDSGGVDGCCFRWLLRLMLLNGVGECGIRCSKGSGLKWSKGIGIRLWLKVGGCLRLRSVWKCILRKRRVDGGRGLSRSKHCGLRSWLHWIPKRRIGWYWIPKRRIRRCWVSKKRISRCCTKCIGHSLSWIGIEAVGGGCKGWSRTKCSKCWLSWCGTKAIGGDSRCWEWKCFLLLIYSKT